MGIVGSEAKGMMLALKDPTVQLWRDSAIGKNRKNNSTRWETNEDLSEDLTGAVMLRQSFEDKVGKQIANTMNRI